MREKELRLALVCFGGVSLAVYMHGISKEILKLVRASRTLHRIADRSRRATARFEDSVPAGRSRVRHRDGLLRSAACHRPARRAARDRRRDRRRLRRRHQRRHAGARAGARSAGRAPARHVAGSRRRRRAARAVRPGARRWSKPFMSPLVWALGWSGLFAHGAQPGSAPEAVAVRALALVQAAVRRPEDDRADVRRRRPHGRARRPGRARCCRPGCSSSCSSR